MTLEAALFATLGPLVSGRAHPVAFPQPPAAPHWPAIRMFMVDGVPVADICGDDDEASDEIRYQLDVVSHYEAGYAAHRALVRQVRAAMSAFSPPARIESYDDEPLDAATQTYRSRIDYIIHGSSAP